MEPLVVGATISAAVAQNNHPCFLRSSMPQIYGARTEQVGLKTVQGRFRSSASVDSSGWLRGVWQFQQISKPRSTGLPQRGHFHVAAAASPPRPAASLAQFPFGQKLSRPNLISAANHQAWLGCCGRRCLSGMSAGNAGSDACAGEYVLEKLGLNQVCRPVDIYKFLVVHACSLPAVGRQSMLITSPDSPPPAGRA